MQPYSPIVRIAAVIAVIPILALPPGQATAQTLDKSRICLEMSGYAKKFFAALQKLDRESPGRRATNIEAVRQFNFDKYKKLVADEGPSPVSGVIAIWDIQRQWGEIGINEYVSNPDASPEVVERRVYERCSSTQSQ